MIEPYHLKINKNVYKLGTETVILLLISQEEKYYYRVVKGIALSSNETSRWTI